MLAAQNTRKQNKATITHLCDCKPILTTVVLPYQSTAMESLFKASVMFLLTFTMPAKTTEPTEQISKPAHRLMAQTIESQEEPGDFFFAGTLLIAE
jgi:hypothetical protein